MTPRELVARIDAWKDIERQRDVIRAYIANGGNLDEIDNQPDPEEERRKAFAMGEAMW